MSKINFLAKVMEDTHMATADIYGTTNQSKLQGSFNEAINTQIRSIAEQEETFELVRQTNQETAVTNKVRDIITAEKVRATEALQSFNRDHPVVD